MTGYQSVQITIDGQDYITDHTRPTIAGVWDAVNDVELLQWAGVPEFDEVDA